MPTDDHEFLRYFTIAEQLSSALIWVSDSWCKWFSSEEFKSFKPFNRCAPFKPFETSIWFTNSKPFMVTVLRYALLNDLNDLNFLNDLNAFNSPRRQRPGTGESF